LKKLSDPDSKYDLEKAKVIANVAQTIINSASVENQYLKIVGGSQNSLSLHCSFRWSKGHLKELEQYNNVLTLAQ
jgi:hypothetical protein